jgi:hypothetical protein
VVPALIAIGVLRGTVCQPLAVSFRDDAVANCVPVIDHKVTEW